MALSENKEFILEIFKFFVGTLPAKLAVLFATGGVGVLSTPYWVPILYKIFEITTDQKIESNDALGWGLVVISLMIFGVETYKKWPQYKKLYYAKDVELFEKLLDLLDVPGSVRYIETHDFLNDAFKEHTDRVIEFYAVWSGASYEFIDRGLQSRLSKLQASARILAEAIAMKTVPDNSMQFVTVRPNHTRGQAIPNWVRQDAISINNACPQFVSDFDELVREGRKLLY